jgi:hypothetical protein
MAKNFTLKNPLNVPVKLKDGYTLSEIRTNPLNASPGDAAIRNILNYSKALSVVPNSLTGNFSLILLN